MVSYLQQGHRPPRVEHAFLFVLRHAGWTYGQVISIDDPTYLRATTACLSAIITMQIVNVFLCRSSTKSLLRTGLRGNRLLGWGVVTEIALLLLINYAPWVNDLLGTRGLDARTWLFLAPFGALMLVLEELRKAFVRRGSTTAEHGREQGRQRNVSPIRDLDQARPDTQHDD